jgi:predicted PurR-regulated permease PerM
MTQPVDEAMITPSDERLKRRERPRRPRTPGFRSADVLRTAALVIAMYLLAQLVKFAHPLFLTAFLGVLFGLAVSSGVDILSRWRLPRGLSAALIVITFFGLLVGFGAWMAPTLHRQGIELRRQLPDAIDRVEAWINARRGGVLGLVLSDVATEARADSAATTQPATAPTTPGAPVANAPRPAGDTTHPPTSIRDRMSSRLSGATRYLFPFLSSTVEVVAGFFLIIFFSIYIAVDPDMYHRGIMVLFPRSKRQRAGEVLSAIAAVLKRWLVTQLVAMLTIGVVTTVLLLVLRVKAAFALGLLAGLFEFIPTVGPIVSSLPAIAMGFLDSPEKALWVGLAYVGIQFFENHLLIPLLMKGGIDLPPALTVFSQALMALTFGFLGLMCAVPLLAASVVAVKMLYVEDIVGEPQLGPGEDPRRGVES